MRRSLLTRLAAASVTASLLVTAPGLGCWDAVAQVVRSAPVGRIGTAAPVAPQTFSTPGGLAPLTPAGVTLALPAPTVLPSVTPTVRVQAAASAAAVPAAVAAAPAAAQAAAAPLAAPAPVSIDHAPAMPAVIGVPALSEAVAPKPAAPLSVATRALRAAPAASFSLLSTLFDGGRQSAGLDAVAGAPGAARLPALNASRPAKTGAQADVPAPDAVPAAAPQRPYALSLALAALGAGAAYFLIPFLVPAMLAHLPFAVAPLALKSAVVAGGFALGASLNERELWRSYPGEVASGAVLAGRTTFRFWARFGRVFHAVLTASSIDAAMKADLPAPFWKYPLLAWPAVLLGYVFAPVVFAFGGVYKGLEIPARAAFRGARRIVVGLLPFMADVFNFIGRAIRAFIPAAGAFLYNGARTAFFTAAGGAVTLAGPVWHSLVSSRYAIDEVWDAKLSQVPAAAAMLLGRGLGLVAALALGSVGALVGFVVGLPLSVTDAFLSFAAKVSPEGAASRAKARWDAAMARAARLEAFHRVSASAGRADGSTLPRALARLTQAVPGAAYALPFSVAGTLGLFAVGLAAAFGHELSDQPSEAAPRRDEAAPASAPAADIKGSVGWTAALTAAGAIAGFLFGPYLLFLVPMAYIPMFIVHPLLVSAGGALLGAVVGLALSQFGAWAGIFKLSYAQAKAGAADSFRYWARLGLAARVNVTGKPVDERLLADAPAALTAYPLLAWPAVLMGYAGAAGGFVIGGAAAALGVPLQAAWRGLVILVSAGLIRKLLRGVKNVIVHGVPFVFGFAFGGLYAELRGAGLFALAAAIPTLRSVVGSEGENPYRHTGLTGLVLKRLVQGLGLVTGLAAGLYALAAGAVLALPIALTAGLRKGLEWADARDSKVTRWLQRWQRNIDSDMKDASGERLGMVLAPRTRDEVGIWQGVVRAGNGALYAALSPVWGLAVVAGVYARAASRASASDKPVSERWSEPNLKTEERPRPQGFLATAAREASDAFEGTRGFWADAGDAFGYAVARREPGSALGYGHQAVGYVAGGLAGLTGAAAGAVEVPGRAVLDFVKDLALKFLPFLKRVWNLAVRIAKRVFPFLGGAVAGAVVGVAGTAAFGALLLGRPWFKYVAAEDYDTSTVGRFLGVAALRLVAAVAGLVFGTLGLAFGLVAALPYSITTMVGLAFTWGGIGGASERFFRNWLGGALPAEMKRVSKLTDSFEFSDKKDGGELAPMDGWVRLGMVTAAAFAASLAATIAGFVAYARSLRSAYRATKAGQEPPSWSGAADGVVGKTAWEGGRVGSKTGRWLGVLGGLAGAGAIAFGALTAPTWLGWMGSGLGLVGLIVFAGPAGWLAGGLLGLGLGTLVGMLRWLDRTIQSVQDDADKPAPPAPPAPGRTRSLSGLAAMLGGAAALRSETLAGFLANMSPTAMAVGALIGLAIGYADRGWKGVPGALGDALVGALAIGGIWLMFLGSLDGLVLIAAATAAGLVRITGAAQAAQPAAAPLERVGTLTPVAPKALAAVPAGAAPATAAPATVALWGVVEVTDGGADISSQAQELVTAHKWSTGMLWWKHRYVTYMLNVAPGDAARFQAAGFTPIKELRVRLTWSRVSDINGWGTEVNGEVHRRAVQELTFAEGDLAAAFQTLRDFETDPLAVLARFPEDAGSVMSRQPVSAFERGYVVSSSIQVLTGHDWTNDAKTLFADGHRSGYYR